MKKYKWLIILGVVILTLSIIAIVFSDKPIDEDKYLREIPLSKVIKKIDNKETFILYIKQTSCEHCKAFSPVFARVLMENKLKAYVLNLTNLSDEENETYNKKFNVNGTPTVLFYSEGSESLVRIEGEQTRDRIISKLQASGFLK
ncbi:MAG: hypothetical protein IJL74_03210 [Bacilli bacterium]|nr:hypothetical protein [Bacilli bacterium]